jgi:hypothetical protein
MKSHARWGLLPTLALLVILAACISTSAATTTQYVSLCPLRSIVPFASGCPPRLTFSAGAAIVPKGLPTHRMAPVGVRIGGEVRNDDGTHPSALREATIDIERNATIDAKGLPACGRRRLVGHDVEAARRVCRTSVVGKGHAHIEIGPSERMPIPITLTLFNGGIIDGTTTVLIHSFVRTPTPASIVATVKLWKLDGGLEAVTKIPPIAQGSGSLLDFNFQVKRIFEHDGEMRSYLTAKCPGGLFRVGASTLFKNEVHASGVSASTMLKGSLTVPCTPRG